MSLFQSTVVLFYVILMVLSLCTFTFATPTEVVGVQSTEIAKVDSYYNYLMTTLHQLGKTMDAIDGRNRRVKRSGESKFSDAAGMSQLKMLQLFVSLISNSMSDDPVGAKHPLSRRVPYAFVALVKHKVGAMFAPELEDLHNDLD